MFSGFTNQISGWVATKTGAGGHAEEDPNAVPQQMAPENGAEMMGEECNPGEGQVLLNPSTPLCVPSSFTDLKTHPFFIYCNISRLEC